jgi:hypothetical protein
MKNLTAVLIKKSSCKGIYGGWGGDCETNCGAGGL